MSKQLELPLNNIDDGVIDLQDICVKVKRILIDSYEKGHKDGFESCYYGVNVAGTDLTDNVDDIMKIIIDQINGSIPNFDSTCIYRGRFSKGREEDKGWELMKYE